MAKSAAPRKKAPAKRTAKKKAARKKRVTAIPKDYPTISAHLTVSNIKKSMELYQKAFGFKLMGEPMRMGRTIIHAVLTQGDSAIMLGAPGPDGLHKTPAAQKLKAQSFGLYVYVRNVDALYKTVKRFRSLTIAGPPMTMFWGDRMFDVVDADGHRWTFASRKSIPTPEEMAAAMQAMMAG